MCVYYKIPSSMVFVQPSHSNLLVWPLHCRKHLPCLTRAIQQWHQYRQAPNMYMHIHTYTCTCIHTCICMLLWSPGPSSPPAGDDDNDRVFVILSVTVVLVTLLIVVVVLSVLIVFYLRYRSEKAKVTSVDHLPTEKNYLASAKPTCLINTVLHVPLQSNKTNRTNRTEQNHNIYV